MSVYSHATSQHYIQESCHAHTAIFEKHLELSMHFFQHIAICSSQKLNTTKIIRTTQTLQESPYNFITYLLSVAPLAMLRSR
jgi:hypothetical protein